MRRNHFHKAPKLVPPQWATNMLSFNPTRAGDFLGDMLAGHNAFIQDIPKKFDAAHAKHFAVVESASLVPVFALSIVHYFSAFTQFSDRAQLLPKLQQESAEKTSSIIFWLDVFAKQNAPASLAWRVGLLTMQVATFPFWLLVASASPAIVHSTMSRVDHIMSSKYECVEKNAPEFIGRHARLTRSSEEFHKARTHLPTDFAAAAVLLLLIWYLTL
ncbi:GPI-anchored surface protein, putative [Bodo saltans]|uniref:GPI-anchored surface protein, putative n=1 Tax=Bodo saltans TaxID=75058 RepID=A0A0S4JEF8_BODSA|nr:GPI-anchored surface protein, putative [Bodo saltans]|eukprot:CUG88369.1 GPI-anchored surface protein, putative [Bodo saltans]